MGTAIRDLHRGGLRAPRAARLRPVLVAAVAAAVAGVAIGVGSSHHAEQALGDLRTRPVREPAPDADRPPPAPRAPVEGGPVDEGARSAAAPVREAVGPVGPDRAAALAGKPESAPAPETMPATVVADAGTERDGDSGAAGRTAATEVVVEKGDNLTQIARRHYGYDSRPLLEEIRRMNPAIVDMDVIPAGRVILLPPDPPVHEAQAAPRPQGD